MTHTEISVAESIRNRIQAIHDTVPDTIGDLMKFELVDADEPRRLYTLRCQTQEWMKNYAGTLHGGMGATILDQAMGFVSYCVRPGEGSTPTVSLQVNYHRPIRPGSSVFVHIHVLSVTKNLIHLHTEVYQEDLPDKLCLSGSGVFFNKSGE